MSAVPKVLYAAHRLDRQAGAGHGGDFTGPGERAVLARKLQEYRSGVLEHSIMNAVTSSLTDEDIADLAEHFANLPGGPTQ